MTRGQIERGIEEFGPWFYEYDFGDGLRTQPAIPPLVVDIHDTRLRMVREAVTRHFGARVHETECLDIGCHQGYYSIAMARLGMSVTAIDARDESLQSARFASAALGFDHIRYRQGHVETLAAHHERAYPLTLFLGLLYHVENPMLCMRQVAAVTGEMCVIETQVVEEVEGFAEWGSYAWTRPYQGILALIDESGEFNAGNRETGITPMATCPSPRALLFMCRQAGFARAEILPPPPNAYEQHARGKRVVCAAYKR